MIVHLGGINKSCDYMRRMLLCLQPLLLYKNVVFLF